jgi:ribosome-binding factor A
MSKHSRRNRASKAQWDTSNLSSGDCEAAGHRHARLEHILTNEIELLIRDEVSDPALSDIRVASVTLSPDGGHARVAFVVEGHLGEEAARKHQAQAALTRAGGFVHARLASHLNLKRTPKLTFTFIGMVEPGALVPEGPSGGEA